MGSKKDGSRRGFAFRRPKPALITDAERSPLENWEHRKRVYGWIQFIRVPFLIASGLSYLWLNNWIIAGILLVISVPLPGIAVVIANGQGEVKDERSKQVYKPQIARTQRTQALAQLQQRDDTQRQLESGESRPQPTIIDHDA